MRSVRLAAASLLLAVSVSACAELLDLEVESVTVELCKCALLPDLEQRWEDDCASHVGVALAGDVDKARSWLELFEAEQCADCANAEKCARAEPLCSPLGGPCVASAACCGHDEQLASSAQCGSSNTCE